MAAAPAPVAVSGSPFSVALAAHADSLPPAFREQFLLAPEDPHAVLFEGRMDRVWRHPAWLWPIFWLLTRPNILFPETGTDVPATMVITAGRDAHGRPYQRWSRTFAFPRPRRFDAMMGYEPARGQVVEWFGRAGRLEIAWDVQFHPRIRSRSLHAGRHCGSGTAACRFRTGCASPSGRLSGPTASAATQLPSTCN